MMVRYIVFAGGVNEPKVRMVCQWALGVACLLTLVSPGLPQESKYKYH